MLASIKWKLHFNKFCQDACNNKNGALFNNSLQLKPVNFCCKNWILDTSRALNITVGKYDFPTTVKGCLPHKWLLNWIRFRPNKNGFFAKYYCNEGGIRDPYHDLRWSYLRKFFETWKQLTPFRFSPNPKCN